MAQINRGSGAETALIRRIARTWSLVIIGLALVMFVGHVFFPDTDPQDYPWIENLGPICISISVLGLALAWRWERLGAVINIGFFILNLGIYWAINGYFFPPRALLIFVPLIVPGCLYLILWQRSSSLSEAS